MNTVYRCLCGEEFGTQLFLRRHLRIWFRKEKGKHGWAM